MATLKFLGCIAGIAVYCLAMIALCVYCMLKVDDLYNSDKLPLWATFIIMGIIMVVCIVIVCALPLILPPIEL